MPIEHDIGSRVASCGEGSIKLTVLHSGTFGETFVQCCAFIRRHVNQAVVGAGPQHSLLFRRFREGEDGVVVFDGSNIERERTAAWLLLALVVARQIAD